MSGDRVKLCEVDVTVDLDNYDWVKLPAEPGKEVTVVKVSQDPERFMILKRTQP